MPSLSRLTPDAAVAATATSAAAAPPPPTTWNQPASLLPRQPPLCSPPRLLFPPPLPPQPAAPSRRREESPLFGAPLVVGGQGGARHAAARRTALPTREFKPRDLTLLCISYALPIAWRSRLVQISSSSASSASPASPPPPGVLFGALSGSGPGPETEGRQMTPSSSSLPAATKLPSFVPCGLAGRRDAYDAPSF